MDSWMRRSEQLQRTGQKRNKEPCSPSLSLSLQNDHSGLKSSMIFFFIRREVVSIGFQYGRHRGHAVQLIKIFFYPPIHPSVDLIWQVLIWNVRLLSIAMLRSQTLKRGFYNHRTAFFD